MKVLVWGGTKFIGAFTVRRLVELGHRVSVFHRGKTNSSTLPDVEHVHGDRKNLVSFRDTFKNMSPDMVLDMISFVQSDAQDLMTTFRGITSQAILISSGDVYRAFRVMLGTEPGPLEPLPLREDAPLRKNRYPYRASALRDPEDPQKWMDDYDKIPIEEIFLSDPELPGTVLRLPAVYGPGDHRPFPFLKRMDDGRKTILLGEQIADWRFPRGHVENVADPIALTVGNESAAGNIYNISDENTPTERVWVEAIGKAAGWSGNIQTVPDEDLPTHLRSPGNAAQSVVYDTSRIRTELGYTERVSLLDGLKKTIAWEREHPPEKIDESQFDYEAEDRVIAGIGS